MRNAIALFVAAVATATSLPTYAAPPSAPSITRVMVVADTSDESSDLLTVAVAGTPLQRTLGGRVAVLPMRDMHDAMRATRTGEYDVIVGPAHVAASALVYGYELIGSTGEGGRNPLATLAMAGTVDANRRATIGRRLRSGERTRATTIRIIALSDRMWL